MPYTPPTRAQLRTSIARDLRDENMKTFTSSVIDDLINFGVAELNRLQPKEELTEVDIVDAEVFEYTLTLTSVWRVELWRDGDFYGFIQPNDDESSQGGWEYWGNQLRIPQISVLDAATDILKVWGYGERDPMTADGDNADVDLDGEMALRAYATYLGFQRLTNDRALFAQWQTASNNTDVSPTQLLGMVNTQAAEWRGMRNRLRRIRRTA